ncbi:HIT domain-containing protein [Streptomyces sp. NBC_00257]|uniref:HIT family protein n=1 Tax=unclassified Streptomyces TaxID=2593676 RepID=UPI00225B63CE|nr:MULTISPECIES: HIT domain-containing protein [unclassified Streptomyces]MCX5431896.1 HIT domain-containing protein [Streptomyces sp. NBC_00062]
MPDHCPFCEIVAERAEAHWVVLRDYWPDTIAIHPLNPVTPGHTLIIPKTHVRDFATDPEVSAATMRRAAELMRWTDRPMNVITSRGQVATQSVFHLHIHLVPRADNDGLALPWHSGRARRQQPTT